MECWKAELEEATTENIANAVEWVGQTPPQTPPIRTNIVEATVKAMSLSEVSAHIMVSLGPNCPVDICICCRLITFTCSPKELQASEHLIYS